MRRRDGTAPSLYVSTQEYQVYWNQLDEHRFACRACSGVFKTASVLKRHIRNIHLNIRYACPICHEHRSKRLELFRNHAIHQHQQPDLRPIMIRQD